MCCVVAGILDLAALADAVERRLGEEEVAVLDQLRHLAIEERHQQRGDVGAVDVGVGHDDDPLVAQPLVAVVGAGAAAQRLDEVLRSPGSRAACRRGAGHVQDLAAQRQDRLGLAVARRPWPSRRAESPSTRKISVPSGGVAAVGQLAGQAELARRGLALLLAVLLAAQPLLGLGDDVLEQDVAGFLVAGQPVLEIVADDGLDQLGRLDADQLFLGLALELRLLDEHRDQAAAPSITSSAVI